MKNNVCSKKKKCKKSHVVSPNCARKFILFCPGTRLAVATFMRLASHT